MTTVSPQERTAFLIRNACTLADCHGSTRSIRERRTGRAASLNRPSPPPSPPPTRRSPYGPRRPSRVQKLASQPHPGSPAEGAPTNNPEQCLRTLLKLVTRFVADSVNPKHLLKPGAYTPHANSGSNDAAMAPLPPPLHWVEDPFSVLGIRCCQHIMFQLHGSQEVLTAALSCATLGAALDKEVWQRMAARQLATLDLHRAGRSHRIYSCAPTPSVDVERALELCWRLDHLQSISRALQKMPRITDQLSSFTVSLCGGAKGSAERTCSDQTMTTTEDPGECEVAMGITFKDSHGNQFSKPKLRGRKSATKEFLREVSQAIGAVDSVTKPRAMRKLLKEAIARIQALQLKLLASEREADQKVLNDAVKQLAVKVAQSCKAMTERAAARLREAYASSNQRVRSMIG